MKNAKGKNVTSNDRYPFLVAKFHRDTIIDHIMKTLPVDGDVYTNDGRTDTLSGLGRSITHKFNISVNTKLYIKFEMYSKGFIRMYVDYKTNPDTYYICLMMPGDSIFINDDGVFLSSAVDDDYIRCRMCCGMNYDKAATDKVVDFFKWLRHYSKSGSYASKITRNVESFKTKQDEIDTMQKELDREMVITTATNTILEDTIGEFRCGDINKFIFWEKDYHIIFNVYSTNGGLFEATIYTNDIHISTSAPHAHLFTDIDDTEFEQKLKPYVPMHEEAIMSAVTQLRKLNTNLNHLLDDVDESDYE